MNNHQGTIFFPHLHPQVLKGKGFLSAGLVLGFYPVVRLPEISTAEKTFKMSYRTESMYTIRKQEERA